MDSCVIVVIIVHFLCSSTTAEIVYSYKHFIQFRDLAYSCGEKTHIVELVGIHEIFHNETLKDVGMFLLFGEERPMSENTRYAQT